MQTKIYFFLTKTTLRRKFFPMTKAGREFFNRRSKQTVSGKGSDWCDFTCNFCFLKWENAHFCYLVIGMQINIMVFTKARVLATSHC